MEIPRIDAGLLRIAAETVAVPPALGLAVGQRLSARVISGSAGEVTLDVRGHHVQARTALSLPPGQTLELEVTGLGPEISLRLVRGAPGISDQQLALATLATAHRSSPGEVRTLWQAVAPQANQAAAPAVAAEISKLLGGVAAETPAAQLATIVKHLVEDSGLLFESRIRAWLEATATGTPAAGLDLPESVSADVKRLLGLLERALMPAGPGEQRWTADASRPPQTALAHEATPRESARSLATRLLEAAARQVTDAGAASRPDLVPLRDAVLTRQVEAAYHWVRDGTLALDLPLLFGDQPVTARLRFRRGPARDRDEAPESASRAGTVCWLDFALSPPGVGAVRAQVELRSSQTSLRFTVERAEVASAMEHQLPELAAHLSRAGLGQVRATVVHDATRAVIGPMPEPTVPAGGSILDARA